MTTTTIIFPWSPFDRSAALLPAVPNSRRLARLHALLIRDEQTRRPPSITLPRLEAGQLTDPRTREAAHEPPAADPPAIDPPHPPPTIPMVLEAVARHFHMEVGDLVGHRRQGGARPTAVNVALALARAATGTPFVRLEKALDAAHGSAWDATSKIGQLRKTNPDLAHQIADIELELGMSQEVA